MSKTYPLNQNAQVPQIKCIYHPEQNVTNFCDSSECMHPLCPVCVAHHINDHKNYRDHAQFKTYDQVVEEVNSEINQFLKTLKTHKDQIDSLEQGLQNSDKNLRSKLNQAHSKAKVLLDEYFRSLFSELDQSIKVTKDRFQQEKLKNVQRLNERAEINVNYASGLYDKDKSARSLMTYLHSDVKEKNEKFIKSLTDLSEFQGLSVKVDTSKLHEIHLLLSKYVEIQNQSILKTNPLASEFIQKSSQQERSQSAVNWTNSTTAQPVQQSSVSFAANQWTTQTGGSTPNFVQNQQSVSAQWLGQQVQTPSNLVQTQQIRQVQPVSVVQTQVQAQPLQQQQHLLIQQPQVQTTQQQLLQPQSVKPVRVIEQVIQQPVIQQPVIQQPVIEKVIQQEPPILNQQSRALLSPKPPTVIYDQQPIQHYSPHSHAQWQSQPPYFDYQQPPCCGPQYYDDYLPSHQLPSHQLPPHQLPPYPLDYDQVQNARSRVETFQPRHYDYDRTVPRYRR